MGLTVLDKDVFLLENDKISLAFDKETGGLVGIAPVASDFNFLQPGIPYLWRASLKHWDGSLATIDNCNTTGVEFGSTRDEDGRLLTLKWTVLFRDANEKMQVTVNVSLPNGSALSYWRIDAEITDSSFGIRDIDFPVVGGMAHQDLHDYRDELSLPWQWGILVYNPLENIARNPKCCSWSMGRSGYKYENDYPCQYTMQYFSYCTGGHGLYLATHDPDTYYKTMGFYGGPGAASMTYRVKNYPENMGPELKSYRLPYDAVIGVFSGDWKTASTIYRQWAIQQKWCRLGALNQRTDIPQWARETSLWYWNWVHHHRNAPEEIVPAAIDLKEKTNVLVAVHWYEWDGYPFNGQVNTPYAHPEKKRQDALKKATETLRQNGIRSIPYINGRLWCIGNNSWAAEGAYEASCKTAEGKSYIEPWVPAHPAAAMCPATSLWRDKLLYMVKDIVGNLGFDGVYIDQIASYNVLPCFDPNHGHPVGGGTYWSDGYHEIMDHIRNEIRKDNPEAVFTTESCCEAFIDCFDVFLTLDACFNHNWLFGVEWEAVPLFTAVYHDYAMTYGGFSTLSRDASVTFALEEGRILCWGSQLMLENYFEEQFEDSRYGADLRFLRRLAQLHAKHREFFISGQWLPNLKLNAPEGKVKLHGETQKGNEIKLCIGSAWKTGTSAAILIGNITNQPVSTEYRFDGREAGLPSGQYELIESSSETDWSKEHSSAIDKPVVHSRAQLAPREFRFIRLYRQSTPAAQE